MLDNDFLLLLVGASQPIFENRLKFSTFELNDIIFELDLSMAFDSIHDISSRRQWAL